MTTTQANGLCNSDKSLLLIVDIQAKLTAVMPDKVVNRLRRHTGMLLKVAQLLDIPVIATEQYPKGLGHLEEAIAHELPQDCPRFEKTRFSCTGADGLTERLADSGRQQIVLTGIEAHVCVLQTAIELSAQGYALFVVGDAVCSRNRENYENALQRLRQSQIVVTDTESVLFEWIRDSKHEHFKILSSLIQTATH